MPVKSKLAIQGVGRVTSSKRDIQGNMGSIPSMTFLFTKTYNTEWEFHGTGLRPMGTPIGKTTGSVLGAQTHGETYRQNDTWLAGRPKYANPPYPWRDPYSGGGASRRPPSGFLYMI